MQRLEPDPATLTRLEAPVVSPAAVYLLSLRSGASRNSQESALTSVASLLTAGRATSATFPWLGMEYEHMVALRSALEENYKPATVNRYLAAVRRVHEEAWRMGLCSRERYERLASVPDLVFTRLPRGRALAREEIRALFAAALSGPSPWKERDAALVALAFGTGERRSEMARLTLDSYTPSTGLLLVDGKGRKERTVPLGKTLRPVLGLWLAQRGDWPGPLLCPISRSGALVGHHLAGSSIDYLLHEIRKTAKVARFTPHDARRTFITSLLDAGVDLGTVAELAGHASTDTTHLYDQAGARRKVAAVERIDLFKDAPW